MMLSYISNNIKTGHYLIVSYITLDSAIYCEMLDLSMYMSRQGWFFLLEPDTIIVHVLSLNYFINHHLIGIQQP